jgi:hypothetical protein
LEATTEKQYPPRGRVRTDVLLLNARGGTGAILIQREQNFSMLPPHPDHRARPTHRAGVAVVLALIIACAGCVVPTSGWMTPMPDITTAHSYVPVEKWQSLVKDRATKEQVIERLGRKGYWSDQYPAVAGFTACVHMTRTLDILVFPGLGGREFVFYWKCQILAVRFDADGRVSSVSETMIDRREPSEGEFF